MIINAAILIAFIAASTPDVMPLHVKLTDGTEFYGFVDESKSNDRTVTFIRDEPWNLNARTANVVTVNRDRIEDMSDREYADQHEKRIAEGWEKHRNMVLTDTVNGKEFRDKTEVTLAQRAREMASAVKTEEISAEPQAGGAVSVDTPKADPPGFLAQWGPMGALVAVGIALIVIVAKFTFLN